MTENPFEKMARGLLERYVLYGDGATKPYLEKMKEGKWETTRCPSCQVLFFPPRTFCPRCLKEPLSWEPLPQEGRLEAFTWQERALVFGKPDCLGFIQLENGVRLFAPILEKYENLSIGDPVVLDWFSFLGIFQAPVFKKKK